MAGLALADLTATLLRPNVEQKSVDLLFREADLFNLIRTAGNVVNGTGGAPYKWNVITASNGSVETFAEGQAPPVAGQPTWKQASLDPFYVRAVVGLTGHMRDNIRGGAYYEDPAALDRMLADADLFKKLDDELCGSTQDRGITSVIASSGTYASIAAASVTVWASQSDAVGGALTLASMEDLYEELTSASQSSVPRGAMPTHVLMNVNQMTNYGRLIGPGNSTAANIKYQFAPGQQFDPGVIKPGLAFNGAPVMRVRGLLTTEIHMLDMTDFELIVHRPLEVKDIVGGNPEMEQVQISIAVAVKVRRRNKHGKLTGVTA